MSIPALFFTAYDRPNYLHRALQSWDNVRGFENWAVVARIEPGFYAGEIVDIFKGFLAGHPNSRIIVNPERYGVLHHPWVGFNELFNDGHEFVLRVEDDLRVSDDILEYVSWAEKQYRTDWEVASVHCYTENHGSPDGAVVEARFNPLVWGTWRDRWEGFMADSWDHDYSTNNGTPGVQAGWDWNLNTRLYPRLGLSGVYPLASRVDNFGLVGTHSTPENFRTSDSFQETFGPRVYRELTEREADIT